MAIAQQDEIKTLEQAQDVLITLIDDIEKIWGQLNSEKFKSGFKNQAEYDSWQYKATDAYKHRRNALKELRDYVRTKFNWDYENVIQLRLCVQQRHMEAPEWLREDVPATQTQLALPVDSPEEEKLEEIVLSLQSQKQHAGILNRLLEARKQANMTQKDAAAYFGIGGQAVGDWERGQTPVTLLNVFRLAALYEVDPLWLLTGHEGIKREALEEVAQYIGVASELLKSLVGKD